jgi:MOSC domain-containing protein YiiM
MRIDRIFISSKISGPQSEISSIEVVQGKGIVSDRNFGLSTYPGQNITFIEAEILENFITNFSRPYDLSISRRNIITREVRLNELVGKTFQIGSVKFLGIELCEPCKQLGKNLSNSSTTPKEIVKWFLNKGGLRANILSSGIIEKGMEFNIT